MEISKQRFRKSGNCPVVTGSPYNCCCGNDFLLHVCLRVINFTLQVGGTYVVRYS